MYMCVHVYIRAYLADCSTQQLRFDIQSVGVASQVQKAVAAHLLAWLSRGRLRWEGSRRLASGDRRRYIAMSNACATLARRWRRMPLGSVTRASGRARGTGRGRGERCCKRVQARQGGWWW